jgi:uncharacterized protein YdaU (DUF1376 family)
MPLYTGDYKRDTERLTLAQHGAYLLLIMHYWDTGGLPDSDEEMARILRISNKQLPSIWLAIAPFFDENRRHKRIDVELEKQEIISTKRQISGRIGGLRRGNKSSMNRIVNAAIAKQTVNHPQPHIQSSSVAEPRARAETPPEPAKSTSVSPSLEAAVRNKGWSQPDKESGLSRKEGRQANGLGDGRSLDQIVRDKGWSAEDPPITSKLLA